jgi:hypothetical protein
MRGGRQFFTVAAAVGVCVTWTAMGHGITTASAQGGAQPTVIMLGGGAAGFFDRKQEFSWGVDESVSPASVEIHPGQSCDVQTTFKCTRTLHKQTDSLGARGQVVVFNAGSCPTRGLTILCQVQGQGQDGSWNAVKTSLLDVSSKPVLQSGEQFTFPCEIKFTPPSVFISFRLVVQATITNFSGWFPGLPCGPIGSAGCSPPSSPNVSQVDSQAQVGQQPQYPNGINFQDSCATRQFKLSDTGTCSFTTHLTNQGSQSGQEFTLTNPVSLTPSDTGQQQQQSDTSPLQISTGPAQTTSNQPFTALQLNVSGLGFFDRNQQFDWNVNLTADQSNVQIQPGQSCKVLHTLKCTRRLATQTDTTGIRGQIMVANVGQGQTQNLTLLNQVQWMGQDGMWRVLKEFLIDVSIRSVLRSGEQCAYPFLIKCAPPQGCQALRNVCLAAISNYSGWYPGLLAGPVGATGFNVPSTPNLIQVNPTAQAFVQPQDLHGLILQSNTPGQYSFQDTGQVQFTNQLTNPDLKGTGFTVTNPVTLMPSDTGQIQPLTDTAPLLVSTGPG